VTSTKDSLLLPDTVVMACLVPLHGSFSILTQFSISRLINAYISAQVVAQMVVSEISATEWTIPDWLPKHYLTTERIECGN
jgi:hypothetical protein